MFHVAPSLPKQLPWSYRYLARLQATASDSTTGRCTGRYIVGCCMRKRRHCAGAACWCFGRAFRNSNKPSLSATIGGDDDSSFFAALSGDATTTARICCGGSASGCGRAACPKPLGCGLPPALQVAPARETARRNRRARPASIAAIGVATEFVCYDFVRWIAIRACVASRGKTFSRCRAPTG